MAETILVVPCYNEAARLPFDAFRHFARAHPSLRLLFVDDGSRDDTLAKLQGLCAQLEGGNAEVLPLPKNVGKAEAVRQGCLRAFAASPRYVGYWDADLATPLDEALTFRRVLAERPGLEIVYGSRVRMLGRTVHRSQVRHALSRVFATAAALTLRLGLNDSQCGAKLFRASPLMGQVFRRPFLTRWLFDVEILARLAQAERGAGLPPVGELVYEQPLEIYFSRGGSKVRPLDFPRAFFELVRIYRHYLQPFARDPDRAAWRELARLRATAPPRDAEAQRPAA